MHGGAQHWIWWWHSGGVSQQQCLIWNFDMDTYKCINTQESRCTNSTAVTQLEQRMWNVKTKACIPPAASALFIQCHFHLYNFVKICSTSIKTTNNFRCSFLCVTVCSLLLRRHGHPYNINIALSFWILDRSTEGDNLLGQQWHTLLAFCNFYTKIGNFTHRSYTLGSYNILTQACNKMNRRFLGTVFGA